MAGLVGLAINASLLDDFTAPTLGPHFLDVYMATLLCFFALQIPWMLHLAPLRQRYLATTLFAMYVVLCCIAVILCVANYVGYRNSGATWALFLIAAVAADAWLAWGRVQLVSRHDNSGGDVDNNNKKGSSGFVASSTWDDAPLPYHGPYVYQATQQPETGSKRTGLLVAAGFNALVLAIAFLISGLLLGGSTVQANGYRSYPPRGQFVTIGNNLHVMVYCTGTFNATVPTFVFDVGGGGHSSSDVYGMQDALNSMGYRVCLYDYPGCGWSDPGDNVSQPMILDQVLTAINEPPPYVLVGTMDGGPDRMYQYALAFPANVKALVSIDYAPGPPEMAQYQIVRNYTTAQAQDYASTTIAGRYALGNLIRGAGVQWGLMSALAPPTTTFVPADRQMEKIFLNLCNEKQWQTQVLVLAYQLSNITLLFQYDTWGTRHTLSPSIPVLWLYNNLNMTRVCVQNNYTPEQCSEASAIQQLTFTYIQQATNMTVGSKIIQYNDATDLLSQGQYIPWTMQQIFTNLAALGILPSTS